MKRVLSLIIALSMLLSVGSGFVFAQGETGYADVDGTGYETPVSILKALNIMSGYTDGGFHPYTTITRAEMAALAVRLRGITDYGDKASMEELQYADMEGHPAEAVVAYARSLGIIDGYDDGCFYPDDPVTYEQAIKMIVGALGYDYYATASGDYPNGYIKVANDLKLTSGVGYTVGAYITRGDTAKIAYNALTVDMMDATKYSGDNRDVTYEVIEGKNLLNTYFNVEKLRGVVEETDRTSLTDVSSLDAGEVRIGNEVFYEGATNISNYLGYYVTFYAVDTDKDKRTIISYKVESNKSNYIEIDAEKIDNVTMSASRYIIDYWKSFNDSKTKQVNISRTPYVIYNGVAYDDFTLSDLNPNIGKLTLIDTDKDGTYDIVDILSYDVMLVLSTSSDSCNVIAGSRYTTGTTSVKLDVTSEDYKAKLVDGDGNSVNFNYIGKNSVVNIATSRDAGSTVRTAIVSNRSIEGKIKAVDSAGRYVINDQAYEAISYMDDPEVMGVGDSGTFYLTYDGKIAGYDGADKLSKSVGMYITYDYGNSKLSSADDIIKIMTSEGSFRELSFASKVKFHGNYAGSLIDAVLTPQAIMSMIADPVNPLFGEAFDSHYSPRVIPAPELRVFLYKLKDGKISEMTLSTRKYNSPEEYANTPKSERKDELAVVWRDDNAGIYYSKNYHCFHKSDVRTYVLDNTVLFHSDDKYYKTEDSSIYSVKTPSQLWENYHYDYYYQHAFYYVNGRDYSDFAMMYDDYDRDTSSGNSSSSEYERLSDPLVKHYLHSMWEKIKVVDSIVESYNDDNDLVYRMIYWENGSSQYCDLHLKAVDWYRIQYRDAAKTQLWRRGDMVVTIRTDGKISAIQSIFAVRKDDGNNAFNLSDYGNAWNDPVGKELNGQKNSDNIYAFKPGSVFYWGLYYDNIDRRNIVHKYDVGRVTEVKPLKYFSVLDLKRGSNDREPLNDEIIAGNCYRFVYDNRGYLHNVENVGNGAIAENQLILTHRNGTNGQIGCRIVESFILYDLDEIAEIVAKYDSVPDVKKPVVAEYRELYKDVLGLEEED